MHTEFNELVTSQFTLKFTTQPVEEPILRLKLTRINLTFSLKFSFYYCYLVYPTAGCIFYKSHSALDILLYHLALSSNNKNNSGVTSW